MLPLYSTVLLVSYDVGNTTNTATNKQKTKRCINLTKLITEKAAEKRVR